MRDIADRVNMIPPSGIRRFFDLAQTMDDVISLGVGEPDFVTPWHVREACIYSLEQGYTSYTSNWGLLELRELISQHVEEEYGVHYNPEEEVLVTTGVSEGVDLAIRALVNPGDEVLVPEPCFVSYVPCVMFAGGVPVQVSTGVENDFRVRAEDLERAVSPDTRALFISYPNNPTGAVLTRKDMEEIADVVVEHDLWAISDEIYDKLIYGVEHTCFSELDGLRDRSVILNGFSKAHAMTGWRLGYALANPEVSEAMMKIHQYIMMCAPITAQKAAIEALGNGNAYVREMVKEYNRRRRLIVKGLNQIGLECFEPKGAFYAFPYIGNTGLSSEEFAEELLREQSVAVVPGDVFGESGEGFVRCSYATSYAEIEEALRRIELFVDDRC